MQNVPKIVLERVRRASHASSEVHPDADLLTAFAEQSLGKSEREHVMEHLSRCGDCRDVVALALPATDSVVMPASSSAVRAAWPNPTWLSWPALRWGVVAAGIVLITSVGLLQYKQRAQQQQSVAVVAMPARQYEKINTAVQNAPDNTPNNAPNTAPNTAPNHDQAPAAQVIGRQDQEMAKVLAGGRARALTGGTQGKKSLDQPSASLNALFPAPQSTSGPKSAAGIGAGSGIGFGSGSGKASPASPQNPNAQLPGAPAGQVSVSGASLAGEVQAEPKAAQDQVHEQLAQNRTDLPSQKQRLDNLDVVKAKDSVAPQAQSGVALARNVPSPNVSLEKGAVSSPRWTISSSGVLQRSFDAGTTWEDVDVSRSSLANGARMQGAAELKNHDRNKQDRNKKVRTKEANPVVVFRAVAALGPEVWAGGTSAMLYHSLDAGSYWTRVVPAEANASLAGDVITVEFSDAQHGKITTSAGELWMTNDDGQTWHKQQ
jgi:hypothetical protein